MSSLVNIILSESSIKIEPVTPSADALPMAVAYSALSKVTPLKSGDKYLVKIHFGDLALGTVDISLPVANQPTWTNDLTGVTQAYNDIAANFNTTKGGSLVVGESEVENGTVGKVFAHGPGDTLIEIDQVSLGKSYSTLASLPGTGELNVIYKVTNDGTASNNGFYHWTGSAYVKDADLTSTTNIVSGETGTAQAGAVADKFTPLNQVYKEETLADVNHNFVVSSYINTTTGAPTYAFHARTTQPMPIEQGYRYFIEGREDNFGVLFKDSLGALIKPLDINGNPMPNYMLTQQNMELIIPSNAVSVEITVRLSNTVGYNNFVFSRLEVSDITVSDIESKLGNLSNPIDPSLIAQGFISSSNAVNTSNTDYWMYNHYVAVTEGETISFFDGVEGMNMTLKTVVAFNSSKVNLSGSSPTDVTQYIVPSGVAFVKLCFYKVQVYRTITSIDFPKLQLSRIGFPNMLNTYGKRITPEQLDNEYRQDLRGVPVLIYGDSISSDDASFSYNKWVGNFRTSTGADIYNLSIGAGNIAIASTRDEGANPYDYPTSHPFTGPDTYNDRHLAPQILHTPNTLRYKYDLIDPQYLNAAGQYILKPEIVIIHMGFNDHKFATGYETWADVKDLTYAQLLARKADGAITVKKVLTYMRLAYEDLMNSLITETRDGYTYGVDARLAKFIFVPPFQSAYSDPVVLGLKEFGDLFKELNESYAVTHLEAWRESGISKRFEFNNALGKFLLDGIHPNRFGASKLGNYIAGQVLATYKK